MVNTNTDAFIHRMDKVQPNKTLSSAVRQQICEWHSILLYKHQNFVEAAQTI